MKFGNVTVPQGLSCAWLL